MNKTAKRLSAALLTSSLVMLVSHTRPLKAKTDSETGSDIATWAEGRKDEIRDLMEPMPQLLLSLPRLDWDQLLTSTELHLIRDPLNPDARFLDLGDKIPRWASPVYREQLTTEGVLILALYDALWSHNLPDFSSYLRNEHIENERRKFFWSKRHPAPTAVYPAPLISELFAARNPLSLKMTNQFRQAEDGQAWPLPKNQSFMQP